jgi:hypothetical protein
MDQLVQRFMDVVRANENYCGKIALTRIGPRWDGVSKPGGILVREKRTGRLDQLIYEN